ncbi:hypothetical protein [Massilia genomosp. 1]|uniref:Photosynthesis system II assembly factor Ycf48/Hcf136-like domain-containing protein n=1 Tax=Massilia genomosp. 1 TaxID=2609280 RepID=A0ABX0MWS8_9BURK|nr:hypothetical protein [Massilia genomosp. 1]NHZ64903.1 hypothetical protein [Massilia genomosp. 1]
MKNRALLMSASSEKSFCNWLKWQVEYSIKVWVTVIGMVSRDCYWLGTVDGEVIRVQGESRQTFKTDIENAIGSLWIQNSDDFWFVHDQGVSHWKEGKVIKSVIKGWLNDIHGLGPNFAVAAGAAGRVIQFDGKDWREIESTPTNTMLVSVFCASKKEIYIGGWNGVLFQWDGKDSWNRIDIVSDKGIVTDEGVYGIVSYLGQIFVGAGARGVYKIDGKKALKVHTAYSSRLNIVDEKLLVTGLDSFAEFDGKEWRTVSVKLPQI